MKTCTAATATATTATIIQLKFSVQLATPKTKMPSLTRFGIAKATTGLVKNVTAFKKQ